MDTDRFDDLLRALAATPSRRVAVRILAGLASGGGLGVQLMLPVAEAKKRRKKKKCKGDTRKCGRKCIPRTSCCSDSECVGDQTCQSGACACPTGKELCGDACVAACAAPSVRNPVTCICCLPTTALCGQPSDPPCCYTGPSACLTACRGGSSGETCQFSAQCNPGLTCVSGTCTS